MNPEATSDRAAQTMEARDFDVIVIGAGPAGSAAATVLADFGRRVALLEKSRFPRYKVGESMIPFCWHPLNRLGLVEAMDAAAFKVFKHSVQFVSVEGTLSKPFYFDEHTEHPCARTWQVVRSDFDRLVRGNAVEKGAELFEETTAREFLREDGKVVGVRCDSPDGPLELRASVTIDATGREALAQQKNNWRVPDQDLKKMAVWTYYEGALRDGGKDEGATTIAYIPDKGWFWYIPLPNDMVSVGVVADKEYLFDETKDLKTIFQREVKRQPWIERHLEPGCCTGEYYVTSDFSYRSQFCAEDGLVLTGDAFAFLDPVFSSGVFLALQGGVMAADAVEEALKVSDTSAERFQAYGERFCAGMEAMRKLVFAFYAQDFNFAEFLNEHPQYQHALTDCLIGNLWRNFDDFFTEMSNYMPVPEPLPHGRQVAG